MFMVYLLFTNDKITTEITRLIQVKTGFIMKIKPVDRCVVDCRFSLNCQLFSNKVNCEGVKNEFALNKE